MEQFYLRHMIKHVRSFRFYSNEAANESILLDPPYQRGDVWGIARRANLIRSLILGIPIGFVVLNDRGLARWVNGDLRIAVIDGKQRITTLLLFLADSFRIPGEWVGLPGKRLLYSQLPSEARSAFLDAAIPVCEARLATVEAEQMVFDLINFGGLRQGEKDQDT